MGKNKKSSKYHKKSSKYHKKSSKYHKKSSKYHKKSSKYHKKSSKYHKKSSKKTLNQRHQKGGGCLNVSNSLDYLKGFGVPHAIIVFCELWVRRGGNICLDQGERQKDTLYLSQGHVHSDTNHIHLFDFKSGVNNDTASAEARDKRD